MGCICLSSSGLNILYQGEAELNKLLKLVLTEGDYCKLSVFITSPFFFNVHLICAFLMQIPGERNSGLSQLRDVILTNLADQLQKNRFCSEEDDHYR